MIKYVHKAMKRRVVKYIVLQRAQHGEIGYIGILMKKDSELYIEPYFGDDVT